MFLLVLALSVRRRAAPQNGRRFAPLQRAALRAASTSGASRRFSGPIWAYLDQLGLSVPIWVYLGLSGPIWPYLNPSGPVWAYLDLSKPI